MKIIDWLNKDSKGLELVLQYVVVLGTVLGVIVLFGFIAS
jgi:hypothetical protein